MPGDMPRFVRVPRLYARRYMRLYARRVCHGSYVWNDTIKEEEKEEEEPRTLILRRVQRRGRSATYLKTTCEALCQGNIPRFIRVRLYMLRKRKKCHVLTCAKALCQEEEWEEEPRILRVPHSYWWITTLILMSKSHTLRIIRGRVVIDTHVATHMDHNMECCVQVWKKSCLRHSRCHAYVCCVLRKKQW